MKRKEQIFIRVKNMENNKVAVFPIEAELAFVINGQRFMYHYDKRFGMGKVTDARTGYAAMKQFPSEDKERFLKRAEKTIRSVWDKYTKEVKKIQRVECWGRVR